MHADDYGEYFKIEATTNVPTQNTKPLHMLSYQRHAGSTQHYLRFVINRKIVTRIMSTGNLDKQAWGPVQAQLRNSQFCTQMERKVAKKLLKHQDKTPANTAYSYKAAVATF